MWAKAKMNMPTFSEPFLPPLFEQQQVSMAALKQTGLPLEETTYLTIGGGIGSFTWVDHLIIHGVDPTKIVAIGLEAKPYARCQRLCRNSQIFDHERLRSDSGGTPDNIWGWPGYALREMWRDLRRGQGRHAVWLTWQIFSEPVLCEPFTPKAGDVFASLDREAQRIGWSKIWRFGWAQAIRKTNDGRYVVAYSPTTAPKRRCKLIVARYVHLAVGYPSLRVLPDLQSYRLQTGHGQRFVNAYEQHDHVYHCLGQTGGTVLLQGRGITASRIIQRLHEEYCHNPNITILHLMRTPRPNGPHYKYARRLTQNHFDHQPYNFPKSCFGGEFRFVMERANDQERAELIGLWGGITTAKRRLWERIITTGLNEGWYQIRFGRLARIEPANNRLTVVVQGDSAWSEETKLQADFIIDATGLEPTPERNPLLQDLLQSYRLPKNCAGQIKVTNNFEIAALRNIIGRVYASGIMTMGGPFAPVDSFVGLQYAAQQSLESLIAQGAPGVRRLGLLRSIIQWSRWAAGVRP
jgi:pSer/pThr/pTyr-binding forkhead associated (FHA) protein